MGLWSGIKYALNSSLGTTGFKPLDRILSEVDDNVKCLWGGVKVFTANGTFTVPANVKKILVTACAGGGGGGGANTRFNWGTGGGGGGGGASIEKRAFAVNPGQVISITVGNGGAPGRSGESSDPNFTTTAGATGASTVIGNLITLPGGTGGAFYRGGLSGGTGGGHGGEGTGPRASNGTSVDGSNGTDGISSGGILMNDGGGGGGSLGMGGSGASQLLPGNGGGGGGSHSDSNSASAGGNGIVMIEW
jgi:hypothetical protein